ncbi:ABC transporter permease [Rubrobacter aplysinae]|uniref:ABC transporter permease n=1 Tax=Rubrobacter aplysinae TaxID=909625 RepID=UPI00069D1352|nr:ABC transporter permease [Rubrobacter aplysinae]
MGDVKNGNVWLILAREYRQRIRTRSFQVITALGFVLILASAFAPAVLDRVQSATGGSTVAVVQPEPGLVETLRTALPEELPNGEPRTEIQAVDSRNAAESGVENGDYDGLLISQGSGSTRSAQSGETSYVYRAPQPGAEADRIQEALSGVAAEQRLQEAGVSGEEAAGVFAPAQLEVEATGGGPSGEEFQATYWLVYVLVFLLYMTVIQYGNMVTMSVITEKSSRITEMMSASVRPVDQMAGKILGVGLLALTQYGLWLAAGIGSLVIGRARGDGLGFGLDAVSPATIVLFLLSFVLGYLLYASILGGLGSLFSRMEDAQQIIGPVIMLLLAGLLITIFSMSSPDGALATVGSYVPFFSPMVMFARAELGSTAGWEIALSYTLLAATVAAAVWAAARLYRTGTLMYGKKPSLAEAARMVLRG